MSNSGSRIIAWDFLRTIAIFLVIWEHCLQYLWKGYPDNPLLYWLFSFNMPLFMSMSGLFALRAYRSMNFIAYCKKRALRILVPCIAWLIIICITYALLNDNFGWSGIKSILIQGLWFFKSLFVCGILGYIAFRTPGNRYVWLIITLVLSQLLQIWMIPVMYPCFILGNLISLHRNWFVKNWKLIVLSTAIVFLLISIPLSLMPSFWKIRNSSLVEATAYSRLLILGSRYLTMFTGLCASTALIVGSLIWLSHSREQKHWILSIANLGRYTLGVYVIQTLVVETIIAHYVQLTVRGNIQFLVVNILIFPLMSAILTWIFAIITAYVSRRMPIVGAILFGEKLLQRVHKLNSRRA